MPNAVQLEGAAADFIACTGFIGADAEAIAKSLSAAARQPPRSIRWVPSCCEQKGSSSIFPNEQYATFEGLQGRVLHARLAPKMLTAAEVRRTLEIARGHADFDLGPDSVDDLPTFELCVCDRGKVLHQDLWDCLQRAVHERLEPWARTSYACPEALVCTAMLRRYLGDERRMHPPHFDGHAFATCVVGLNPSDFQGGLYMQPTPRAPKQFVALGPGDAVMHQYDLRHGVDVIDGERYSLIFWLKDTMQSCLHGLTPWYDAAIARGDGDAAYNRANFLVASGKLVQARSLYRVAALVGQADAASNLGVMLHEGLGGPSATTDACHWWREAASLGKAAAACNLGNVLLAIARGASDQRGMAEGIAWLRAASRGQDAEALAHLSDLPDTDAWRPGPAARRRWAIRAARRGHPRGQFSLGERALQSWRDLVESPYYSNSKECALAWREAVSWLGQASKAGAVQAMLLLAQVHTEQRAPLHRSARPMSRTWLLRAARSAGPKDWELIPEIDAMLAMHYMQGSLIERPFASSVAHVTTPGLRELCSLACVGKRPRGCQPGELCTSAGILSVWR